MLSELLREEIAGVVSRLRATLSRTDRPGRRAVALTTAAALVLGGTLIATATPAQAANASGTVVGSATWPANIGDLGNAGVWATDDLGVGATPATSPTPSTEILLYNEHGGAYGPANLGVSASPTHPGLYVTPGLNLHDQAAASAAALARYKSAAGGGVTFTQTANVDWVAKGSSNIVTVEIPIVAGFNNNTCGMEVNPTTFAFVVMNDCNPGTQTGYMVLDPGPDQDPTTIADNVFHTIKAPAPGLDGGVISDMTLDAAGNIYNLSANGTAGNILRTDHLTGVVTNVGSFVPAATVGAYNTNSWGLAFYKGKIINMSGNRGANSLGINPLSLTAAAEPGTDFTNLPADFDPNLDGAGTSGAIALEGTVTNASDDAGLGGQTVAIYRSNGDGTATLAGYRTTASDGTFNFLLDSDSTTFYARVVQPRLTTSGQVKNGEVVSIDTSFTTGGSVTASTITSKGGSNGIDPALGTVGTTKITVADTNDLVTYDVKDARAVAEADFSVAFAGSTADRNSNAALTTTAATGYGPQHLSVTDLYRLGATNGSYLIGATDNSHTSDDGVRASLGGVSASLANGQYLAGLGYPLTADSQGTDATNAVISAWAGSNTATTWTSMGTITSATGSGSKALTFTPSAAGTATLRFNTSKTAVTSATNANGEYAATTATAGTKPWTTAGEVEDYAGTIYPATNSLTRLQQTNITGTPTYTYSGGGTTAGSTTITDAGFAAGALVGTSGTFTVTASNIPTGFTLARVLQVNTITGATMATLTPSGNAVTATLAAGTDSVLRFVYKQTAEASTSTIVASPTSTTAGSSSTISVTLKTAGGNPVGVGGDTVAISSDLGSVGAVTDNGDGTYTATLTSTVAGTATVSFTVNGTSATATASVDFATGPVSAANSTVAIDNSTAVPVDTGSHVITVTVKDANGNPISGQASNLSASGATVSAFTAGAAGVYTATVTSTTSGTKNVTVSHSTAGALSPVVAANFAAGAISSADSTVAIDNATAVSVDGGSHVVTVTLKDANGNPVTGAAGSLSGAGTDVSVGAFGETGTGVYTAQVTSTKSGGHVVTVSHATAGALSPTVTANFAAGAVNLANSSFTVGTAAVVAGSTPGVTVTATLRDANNNLVTSADAAKLAGTATGSASVGAFVSNGDGTYSAHVTSTVAGAKTVAVTFDGGTVPAGANDTATFTAGAVSLANSGYTVSATSVVAGSAPGVPVTVTLKDANSNPISGQAAKLTASASPSTGVTVPVSWTDNGDGTYSGYVTSTKSGAKAITVSYDGTAMTYDVNTATFTAGAVSLANSSVTVGATAVVAGSTPGVPVTATLRDANDNVISDADAAMFAGTATNSALVGPFTSNGDGTYSAHVTSTLAGTKTVAVTFDGGTVPVGANATATFKPGAASVSASTIVANPTTKTAGGSSTITVTLKDANGNQLTSGGATVAIDSSLGAVGSVTDHGDGTYTASLTSTVAGVATVSFSVGGVDSTNTASVTFNAGAVDLSDNANSNFTVATTSVPADGTSTVAITVKLADQYGNKVSLSDLSKLTATASPSAGVSIGAFSQTTLGTYTAAITSTSVGYKTIAVSYDGSAVSLAASGNDTATFVKVPVDINASGFVVSDAPVVADGAATATVTVTLVNTGGSAASGWASDLAASASPSGSVTLSAFTESPTNPGTYTATVASTVAGAKSITVTQTSTGSTLTATDGKNVATFVADDASAANSSVSIDSATPVVADGSASHLITITLADANNNPVTGKAASISMAAANNTDNKVTFGSVTETGTPGTYTAVVRSTEAGTQTVTVTFAGTSSVTIGSVDANFAAGAPDLGVTGKSWIEATTGDKTANGTSYHTVTATILDAYGNPISGRDVVFTLDAGLSVASGGSTTVSTDASGVAALKVVSTTAGSYNVIGKVDGDLTVLRGSPVSASFVAGAPSVTTTTLTASAGEVVADGTSSHAVTVTVRDANGNPIANQAVAFDLPGSLYVKGATDNSPSTEFVNTDANGQATLDVVTTVPGTYPVFAEVGGFAVTQPSPMVTVTFVSGAADAGRSVFMITPSSPQVVGSTFTATVILMDMWGSFVPEGQEVTFTLPAGVTASANPCVTIGDPAECTITLTSTTAGTYDIQAAVGGDQIGFLIPITFTAGAADLGETGTSTLAVDTADAVVADGTASHSLTATVNDAYGNPVSTNVVFELPAGLTAVGSTTVATNAAGVATLEVTSTAAGAFAVNAYVGSIDPANLINNGSPATANFVAGAPVAGNSSFAINEAGPLMVGTAPVNTYTGTITVRDANNNPVPNASVVLRASLADQTQVTGTTDASGVFTGSFTSTVAGTTTFTGYVLIGGVETSVASADRTWTAGTPVSGGASAVSGTTGTRTADGIDAHNLTAFVADIFGNPVPNASVAIVLPSGVSLASGTAAATTGADGKATWNVVSATMGTYSVTATVTTTNGVENITAGSPVSLKYIAGAPSSATSALNLTADTSGTPVANGSDAYSATATVKDANGNLVEGAQVTFSVATGASLSALTAYTNASGVASVKVTSVTAGSFAVNATVGGTDVAGSPGNAAFVAGDPDLSDNANSHFSVSSATVVADGSSAATITVALADAHGNPVAGADTSKFAVTSNPATGVTVPTSWTDNGDGTYTAPVTSTVAGKKTIGVTFDGTAVLLASGGNKIAWFVAGAPSAADSTITATGPVQANGASTSTVTVKLLDAQGNSVTTTHTVVVATSVGSVSAQATSNGDGTYTASLTSTAVGDATVSFTIDATSATQTATVSFVEKLAAPIVNPSNGSTVSGTTEPSTTVRVYGPDGTTVICETTSDTAGDFTCSPLTPQPTDGQQISVVAVDSNGFEGTAAQVTIDASAPVKPVVTAPSDSSAINDSTPTISGTGEPGATVAVTDEDGHVLCTATVAADQTWSCTSAALADGDHTLAATQTDPAGNTSPASDPVTVTVDTASPVKPAITSPASGAAINDATPTLSGTGEAGATLTVSDSSGNTVCTTTVATDGSWSCTASTLADGAQTLTATQTDAAGNTSPASDPISVTIDTAPPAKPVVSTPANGSATNDTTPTFSGTGEAGATVTVSDSSGNTVCTTTVAADGSWSCTGTTPMVDGTQVLSVTQTDPAGNTSAATTVSVVIDTAAPSAPSVNPSNGTSVSGTAEPGSTVTVADASGTTLCTATAAADGSWSCVPSPTPADADVLSVTATDPGGNISPVTTVTVDATAPDAPAVNPTNGSAISGTAEAGTTVTITYTAADGSTHTTSVVAAGDGSWSTTLSPAAKDATAVTVTATDDSGNVSAATTVYADSTPPVNPTVNPTNGSTVSGTAEAGSSVQISYTDAAGDAHTVTVTAGSDGTWTTPLSPAAADATQVSVTATDAAGNTSGATKVTVDSSAPAAPSVAPSNGETVRITGVEGDATPSMVDSLGAPVPGTWVDNGSGSWTFTPTTPLTESDKVSVVLTDGSGNTSTPVAVVVDTTAPDAPVIDPSNGSSVSGSAEADSTVTVTYTGTDGASHTVTVTADSNGKWVLPLSPAAEDGTDITATATDAAGNVSPIATVTADSTPPNAPNVNPSNGSLASGTAEAGSTVTLTYTGTDGSTHTVEVPVASDGSWSTPLSPAAADGSTLSVVATDAAGNTSPSTDVIVDSTAPDAPVVSPTQGAVVSGTAEADSTVTISYTGTDGATHTATATVAADGTWSATLSPAAANGTTVTATATDAAGNTSAPGTVVADSQAPAAPSLDPSNGSSVSGTAEPGSTVTVTYTGTDGSTHTATVTADTNGDWSLPLSPAAVDGSTITATATDASGNVSGEGSTTADSTPPDAPVLNPSNGSSVSGAAEPGSTVTITYTGTDGSTHTATVTAGPDGTWSKALSPAAEDGSTVSVTASDAAGNTSTPATVVADSTPPAAPTVNGPTTGSPITGTAEVGSTVTVTYTGTDGATHTTTVTVQPDGSWSTSLVPAPKDGTDISVTASDPSGNVSDPTTVKADTSAPDVPVLNPSNGTTVSGTAEPGSTVTITYTGTDGATHTATATAGPDGGWTATLSPAAEDGSTISVTATDAAGNVSAPGRVIADSTAPNAPTINPSNGTTVAGTAEPGSTVTLHYTDVSGKPQTTQVTAGKDGSWSATLSPTAEDGSTITATATDAANNVSQPGSTTVDATAPNPPVLNPSNGNSASGTAEPGSTVTVTYPGTDGDQHTITVVVGDDGSWEVPLVPPAANGGAVSVVATDPVGNTSSPTVITVAAIWMDLKWDSNTTGTTQVAYGHNFLPGEVVTGVAHSTPLALGTQVADAKGDVTFTFTVPTNFSLGTDNHRVTLTGAKSGSVYHLFSLHSDGSDSLAYTGVAIGVPISLGLLALLGGWWLVLAARRKKEDAEA